jgi:hypothetical protein
MRISRRQLGEGLGGLSLFAGLARVLGEGSARAAGATAKNLVVITSGDGSTPDEWSYDSFLAPLLAMKSQIAVVRGMKFADGSRNSNHNGAEVALRGNGTGLFGGASVDHYIAKAKGTVDVGGNGYGLVVPMTSDAPGTTQSRVSYDLGGKIASFPHTPLAGFKKLFPDAKTTSEGTPFVDLALDELAAMRPRLGAAERSKVDAVADSLGRLKKGPGSTSTCTNTTPPSTIDTISSSQFADVSKAHMDLAVLALSCGVTNVITVQFGEDQSFSPAFTNVPGVMSSESQHSASHANSPTYFAMQKFYSTQVAYLLTQLEAKGILKDTLVVRSFDFGRGDHQGQKLTFVPCFFAGAGIKGGTEVDVGATADSHHGFLATICAATGAPVPAGATPFAQVLA